jgi:hypothetical protein
MVAFIDQHRGTYGVESICQVLPIAPIEVFPPSRRAARSHDTITASPS